MELNKYIDHTLLKADATKEQIKQLCMEAKQYQFASVCVNPYYVPLCKKLLAKSGVKVCTVIGFPLGQISYKAKIFEAYDAIKDGANEIDMVINIPALKAKDFDYVVKEILLINQVCKEEKVLLKVIIETCLLSKQNIIDACRCVSLAKADFIKTSTGFSTAGATVENVALIKKYVDKKVKIKAAGGIRNKQDALKMIEAGASRLGTSQGVALVTGK